MINNKTIHTLSVYVTNKPGVPARIAQPFSRRGFHIESLVVSPAMDGHFSRMTIGVSGDPDGLDQIIRQVSKLIDVLHCTGHTFDGAANGRRPFRRVWQVFNPANPAKWMRHFNRETL